MVINTPSLGLEFCCKCRYYIKEKYIRNILSLTHLQNKPHNGICSEGHNVGKESRQQI
jgi:hypothetical protein